jgi:hypothetical protein
MERVPDPTVAISQTELIELIGLLADVHVALMGHRSPDDDETELEQRVLSVQARLGRCVQRISCATAGRSHKPDMKTAGAGPTLARRRREGWQLYMVCQCAGPERHMPAPMPRTNPNEIAEMFFCARVFAATEKAFVQSGEIGTALESRRRGDLLLDKLARTGPPGPETSAGGKAFDDWVRRQPQDDEIANVIGTCSKLSNAAAAQAGQP